MENCKIEKLFNLEQTSAKELFEKTIYPWEILPKISNYILEKGKTLDANHDYIKLDSDIWVHKTAKILKSVYINGPCIIEENTEVRHSAFIRGNAFIGKNCVVGNSTELKNVILFNNVQVPHYNYIGDSILGYKSHMGASSLTSNVKSDKTLVVIKDYENNIEIKTNLKKVGAIVGDFVEVGCGSVLNPGTIIGKNTNIYPLSSVRGVIKENSIYKSENKIVEKLEKQKGE